MVVKTPIVDSFLSLAPLRTRHSGNKSPAAVKKGCNEEVRNSRSSALSGATLKYHIYVCT